MEQLDGAGAFSEDRWNHPAGGGGRTRIIQNGNVFEKGGVNFSAVETRTPDRLAQSLGVGPQGLFATGISLVLHPLSPFVPIVHMNLRFLELESGDCWFGGGADLTPSYFFEEDARHFHFALKSACERHQCADYARFKQQCDEYFMLKHRKETRGIGGIFFDYLRGDGSALAAFVRDLGISFSGAYLPIVERTKDIAWNASHKEWQLLRRGRYAEFNLALDRGTQFGLDTGGRTESILMSLPPHAAWAYNHEPRPGSPEAEMLAILRNPQRWA